MTYTRKGVAIPLHYFIDDMILNSVNQVMDLGVLFDAEPAVTNHITKILYP